MNLEITPLSKNLAEKHADRFLSFTEDQEWESWTIENLLQDCPGKWERSFCALIAGVPVGYLIASEKEKSIHIHHLAIEKAHRRNNIGYLLVRHLENQILSTGLSLPLTLKVFRHNAEAKNFYHRLKFEDGVEEIHNTDYVPLKKENNNIKKITYAVHQPNFLPWLGYFAKMQAVDVFIFLDDVQMPQGRSYVSRSLIRSSKQNDPSQWLTVPVRKKNKANINEIEISNDEPWLKNHISKLTHLYGKSPYYKETLDLLHDVYKVQPVYLNDFNTNLILKIKNEMGITCKTLHSSFFKIKTLSDQRIIDLGKILNAAEYISGKGGENYQLKENFEKENISLKVTSYPMQPYEAPGFPFHYGFSVIDSLFIHGLKNIKELLNLNVEIYS